MKTKQKVIYIAGQGHSGSTLLEVYLQSFEGFVSCGEIETLPNAWNGASETNKWCGCRKLLNTCPFWIELLAKVQPWEKTKPHFSHFRRLDGTNNMSPFDHILLWFGKSLLPSNQQVIYGNNNADLIDAYIAMYSQQPHQPKVEVLIDSSKNPGRLDSLLSADCWDLSVVHIIRDPRLRHQKYLKRNGVSTFRLRDAWHAIKESLRWSMINSSVTAVCNTHGIDQHVISYERFAKSPAEEISRAGIKVGVQKMENIFEVECHTVTGNAGTRFHSSQIVKPQLDLNDYPKLYAWLMRTMSYPFRAFFGFELVSLE